MNQVHGQASSGQTSIERSFAEQKTYLDSLFGKINQFCPRVADGSNSQNVPVVDYEGSGDTTNDAGSGDDEDTPEGEVQSKSVCNKA